MPRKKAAAAAAPTDALIQDQVTEAHHAAVGEALAGIPTADPVERPRQEADIFDQMAAAHQAGQFEQPPLRPQSPPDLLTGQEVVQSVAEATRLPDEVVPEQNGHATRHRPEGARQYQPGPFPMESITLGEGDDAPRMRLFRNNRAGVVAIQLDWC